MEPQQLRSHAPGTLLPVHEDGGTAWVFLPSPLAPAIEADWALTNAVAGADRALSSFITAAEFVQNTELIMRPFRQREAALSSRIEGTQTLVRELVEADAIPGLEQNEDSDRYEVENYLRALNTGLQKLTEGYPLGTSFIRGLHAELMRGVRGKDKHPGQFRAGMVSIGGNRHSLIGARFVPPPPEHVTSLIDNLVDFLASESKFGTLIDTAIFHYQFETIHPFEDGNGRLGRLLIPLFLTSRKVLSQPILYLSPYFEAHSDQYRELLLKVSTQGEWQSWLMFFLEAVRDQAEDSHRRVRQILALQSEYRKRTEKLGTAQAAALRTVDLIMERVAVTAPDVARRTKMAYPTARATLDRLTELGIMVPSSRYTRPQLWVAEELLQSVYEA
jgi:Fic family protein